MRRDTEHAVRRVLAVVLLAVCATNATLRAEPETPQQAETEQASPIRFWIVSCRKCPLQGKQVSKGTSFEYLSCHETGDVEWGDQESFHKSLIPNAPVCVVVHGSFVNWNGVAIDGMRTWKWLRSVAPKRPLNVVVFSWRSAGPFTIVTRNLVFSAVPQVDVGILGQRSGFAGLYLGRMITDLPVKHPVSLVGHSHGARTIGSALHLMAGGQVQGFVLADRPTKPRRIRAVLAAAALDHHWLNPSEVYGRALDSTESLLNLRNERDTVLQIYQLRHPLSKSSLATTGFTTQDRAAMGKRAERVDEIDVSQVVGTGHIWQHYSGYNELAKAIAGYVYFDAKSRGAATSVEGTRLRTIRR